MSFKTYRAIDIAILIAVMTIGELLVAYASNAWFELNALGISIVFPLLIIISMRWGVLVIIPAIIGGAITCLFSQMSGGQQMTPAVILISEVGGLTILFSPVWFKLIGKQKTKESWAFAITFVALMYVLNCVGKGVATAIVNSVNFFACTIYYFTRDSITLLFASIVVLIVRKLDGVFEDQKAYLFRLEKQREQEKLHSDASQKQQ